MKQNLHFWQVDIFAYLNKFNKKIQGRNSNILTSSDKIKRFCAKLQINHATNGNNEMFSNVMATDSEKSADYDSETLGAISRKN